MLRFLGGSSTLASASITGGGTLMPCGSVSMAVHGVPASVDSSWLSSEAAACSSMRLRLSVACTRLGVTGLKATASFGRRRACRQRAQDWMTDEQLNTVWTEMTRTAAKGARIIFRTAAERSIVDGRLRPEIDSQWRYLAEQSVDIGKAVRSAIYGGVHM